MCKNACGLLRTTKVLLFYIPTKQKSNFKWLIINKLQYSYILTFCYKSLILSQLRNCLIIKGLAPLRAWNESVSPHVGIFQFFLKIFIFSFLFNIIIFIEFVQGFMGMYQNERSDDFPLDFPRFVHRVYLQRVTFVLMNKMNKMNKILFIMFCCFLFLFIELGQ